MLQIEMAASLRTTSGKGAMRKLRQNGMTPAVLYSKGSEGLSLQLETKSMTAQLLEISRRNAVITLKIEGEVDRHVLLKEVQAHPVKDTLVHADFYEINTAEARIFNVPISFTGNAKGIDLGGILNVFSETVQLEGKPFDIPDACEIDVSEMDIGDTISFSAITVPENIIMISDPKDNCVSVIMAGVSAADEEEGEEEAVEEAAEETTEE